MHLGLSISVTTLDDQAILTDESVLCLVVVLAGGPMRVKCMSMDRNYGSKAALQSISQICQLFATVITKTIPHQWWQPARATHT